MIVLLCFYDHPSLCFIIHSMVSMLVKMNNASTVQFPFIQERVIKK